MGNTPEDPISVRNALRDQVRYAGLSEVERMQVEAVAGELLTIGSYRGSESDAITDAVALVRAAVFAPPLGDNHHNARLCPVCTPGSYAPDDPSR